MIFNKKAKEFQFASIFCKTRKEAEQRLFRTIGKDAYKYRFEIRQVKYDEGKLIQKQIKLKSKAKRIMQELQLLDFETAILLVKRYSSKY